MAHYVLAEPLGSDLVLADAEHEAIRLWRAFSGQSLKTTWEAPPVGIQKRARRADVMNFLRNAPAATARGVAELSPHVGESVEFLPLKTTANQPPLFALNALVVLSDPTRADDVGIFRVNGETRDAVYFSEAFKIRAESTPELGLRFVPASKRYPRRAAEQWGVAGSREICNCDPPATVERIADAETRAGLQFPESLRWLFSHANGGRPSDDASGIHELESLRNGRGSAEWTYELLAVHFGVVPWTWFPFAVDGGGNTFFVDCSTREGAVYLWLHDTNHERIQPLTETLAEFVGTIARVEAGLGQLKEANR